MNSQAQAPQLSLFSPEDSPASRFPQQESEKERQTTVISGRKCLELSERLGQPTSLAKTLLASSVWRMSPHLRNGYTLEWKVKTISEESIRDISIVKGSLLYLMKSLKVLKEKVIPSKRILFQLAVSAPGTEETESGLLLTPTATMGGAEHPDKTRARNSKYNNGTKWNNLISQVVYGFLPTPISRDWRSGMSLEHVQKRAQENASGVNLSEYIQRVDGSNGKLNPEWVEWLMGYPTGWTDLER